MDPTIWIETVAALAGLVKAWFELRKAKVDLDQARAGLGKTAATQPAKTPTRKARVATSMVIDPMLVKSDL